MSFESTRSMPPSTGSAPPESPVPAPRATTGVPCAAAIRSTDWTSAVLPGSTTRSGVRLCAVSASHSKATQDSAAVRTESEPSASRNARSSAGSVATPQRYDAGGASDQ